MNRSKPFQIEILRRIRIGRFEYIGVDESVTPSVYYVGYGIPPMWTRVEYIANHYTLTREVTLELEEMITKTRKKREMKNAQVERGNWDNRNS